MTKIESEREAYEAPKLAHLGMVGEVTLGQSTGTATDRVFPVGTTPDQFTFS